MDRWSFSLGDDAYSFPCDRPRDGACQLPANSKEFKCARHIVPGGESKGSRFLAAITPLFQESVGRFISPVSRGLEATFNDSVVKVQMNTIDLAPAFEGMESGTYRVQFEALGGAGKKSGEVRVKWTGSGAAMGTVPGMQPGLYSLRSLNGNGETVGPAEAWVLVSGEDRFAKDSADFKAAVEATKKWPEDVDARAAHAVLRAYLEALSRPAAGAR